LVLLKVNVTLEAGVVNEKVTVTRRSCRNNYQAADHRHRTHFPQRACISDNGLRNSVTNITHDGINAMDNLVLIAF